MKTNMSSTDRIIRAFVAVALVAFAMKGTFGGNLDIVAYVVAGVFMITSVVSFCPIYALFGMSTKRVNG